MPKPLQEKLKTLLTNLTLTQQKAYGAGVLIATAGVVLLLTPGFESWHSAGPANIGHGKIDCNECHTPAPGNLVGQALNNALYLVGLSDSDSDFIFTAAGNMQCLDCHDNPDDRHPVADFLEEPEFAEAREALSVQYCVSCHREHLGIRANVTPLACQYCHQETEVENDPVDVPHTILISEQRWETCLGCHDFHGNHDHHAPTKVSDALTEEQIQHYLDGGKSPYGYRVLSVIQTMREKQ